MSSMSSRTRTFGIDAFRLLTAVFVITSHGGRFEQFPEGVHTGIALMGRWAVPFFFIVLGYFLARNPDKNRAMPQMIRLGVMLVVASLILMPLNIAQEGVYGAVETVSTYFLLCGGHFHLWFLSSLIMGLLVIRITDEYEIPWLLPLCAIVSLVLAIWLGSYWSFASSHLGRHLSSIPFLWFGMLLSTRKLSVKDSLTLIACGVGILCIEAVVLKQWFAQGMWESPTSLGAVPFAVGMFALATNIPNTKFVVAAGKLGKRYTGCIYVTHVYFIWLVDQAATNMGIHDNLVYCALVVPTVLGLNLLTLLAIDRFAPTCIDVLLGDKRAIQHAASALTAWPRTVFESTGMWAAAKLRQ